MRRTYQAATEMINQASDAPMKAAAMLLSAINEKTTAKANIPRAECGAGGVDRGRHLPPALAGEARLALAADFVLLDQRGAGAEDRRKSKEKAADEGSIAAADETGEDGRGAAERKAYYVFVPAALPES